MSCGSVTGSERGRQGSPDVPGPLPRRARDLRGRARAALCLALALGFAACSSTREKTAKPVLTAKQGETSIQVVETDEHGNRVVRVTTSNKGEERSIVMQIREPVYDVEIPLTQEQLAPQSAARGPGGDLQALLIAQYLEKAQESMLAGNYLGALSQVNLVLVIQPDHAQAHAMKGSVYYTIGSYELAKEEWQRTLELDPSNEEVRDFMDFLQHRKATSRPPLPGAPKAAPAAPAPKGAPQAPPAGQAPPEPAQPRKGGTP